MIPPLLRPLVWISACSLAVTACAPPRKVAVEERKTITIEEEAERLGGTHIRIVQPGDTLYGIAFANQLDAKDLAAWNGVRDTGRLRVGQRLRLTRPPGFVENPTATTAVSIAKSKSPATNSTRSKRPSNVEIKSTASTPKPNITAGWRWPTAGRVSANFNLARGQQGIDIRGQQGQTVVATQSGEVVYVGNSLKGYGNLVIVKHDDDYLSAYAHNFETFVQEGQRLSAGQRLATMGLQKGQAALHFQIRLRGEPVDPLRFLPKR